MCPLLKVSRVPLREAYRILESEGFVENRACKGVFVSRLSRKQAVDIYTTRANLESLAVRKEGPGLAARAHDTHRDMREAVASGDAEAYVRASFSFHEILIAACGSPRLIDMLRRFNKQTARYRRRILAAPGKPEESLKRHEELSACIEKGDAQEAERLRKKAILSNIALVEAIFSSEDVPGAAVPDRTGTEKHVLQR